MKVLLFGSRGYLGEQFLERYPDAVCPRIDIADGAAVAKTLEEAQPDVVINAAGKTGRPNVDWCEEHKEETLRANVTGPLVLMHECAKRGITLVHLSSGCIYSGDNGGKGWSEEDPPNFSGSFYSRSKAWADQILREFADGPGGILILRMRMPFGKGPHPRSLITKLSGYARVLDVPNAVTYLPDFLDAAAALIERNATGVFNVVNPGAISPYAIMERYTTIVDPAHSFERLTLDDLSEVVHAGRSNCLLSTAKLSAAGVTMRPVEEAVDEALRAFPGQKS